MGDFGGGFSIRVVSQRNVLTSPLIAQDGPEERRRYADFLGRSLG